MHNSICILITICLFFRVFFFNRTWCFFLFFFFFLFAHIINLWVSWWEFLFRFHLPSSSWSSFSAWKRNWVSARARFWSQFFHCFVRRDCFTHFVFHIPTGADGCEKEKVYCNRFNFSPHRKFPMRFTATQKFDLHMQNHHAYLRVSFSLSLSFSPLPFVPLFWILEKCDDGWSEIRREKPKHKEIKRDMCKKEKFGVWHQMVVRACVCFCVINWRIL